MPSAKTSRNANANLNVRAAARKSPRIAKCEYHHQSTLRAKNCTMEVASVTIGLHCKNLGTMYVASVTVAARRAKKKSHNAICKCDRQGALREILHHVQLVDTIVKANAV